MARPDGPPSLCYKGMDPNTDHLEDTLVADGAVVCQRRLGSVTGGAPAPVRGHGHTQLLHTHAHPLLQGPNQLTGVTQVPDPNQSPSRPNCSSGTSPPRLLHVFREKACKPHLLPPVYPSRASCPVRCKAPNSSTQSHLFSPPTHTHLCVRVQRCSRGGPHALCMVEQHVEQ